MQSSRTVITAIILAVIVMLGSLYSVFAQSQSLSERSGLSSYWSPNVLRWEPFILSAAEERELDPDLIAAVIWKESLGRAWERGPVGAVGLMGIMPFEWRPSVEELENPWTNVAWGARALAHTIRDGNGDLYYALAAYNGGWGKIHLRVTRGYAADVLNHYTRAVAVRHGLPDDGDWVAIFAIEGAPDPSTITVIGPQRTLARYTERPWVQADIPTVPVGVPPLATVITFVDEYGTSRRVNVWLVSPDDSPLELSVVPTFAPPIPTEVPYTEPSQPLSPIGTPIPVPGAASAVSTTHTTLPTETLPTTQTVECAGGPLQLNAWHLNKEWTSDAWMATIFVQGHGGDCTYTYTWEGEIKGGPMSGPITFDLYAPNFEAYIMGTASVTSAGETVEVGLLLKPTGD
ncbi:MAG: lytic transglycosylase domain-containing protein [Chloroflexi bacterium]|nr:lytic transglycosylase domain-containing protein [Chloroflexota bacterium]